jgi:transcriptional regulator with XRE-family HTH domain
MANGDSNGKYREHMVGAVKWMAAYGLTDEEIATELGISRKTLCEWKKKHPEFAEALRGGKYLADAQVEDALFTRALGYEYEETERRLNKRTGRLEATKITTKKVEPSTTAQIFWLKNRRPDRWRDKQEIEHGGNIEVLFPESMKDG